MSLVHGTGVDGATATGVNPVMIAGKDAAGNIDTLKVESGVASFSDAALAALIGEKQASPTANTLLARIKALETALAGNLNVALSGSNMDLRGTAATKPLATAVTIGATYWSVDTDPHAEAVEVSDGTNWVVI